MLQQRWDVQLLFLSGPLVRKGPMWFEGSTIELGRNPEPGGVDLRFYQGIAAVHARIQAYEGNKVTITPIQNHEIRIAEHENVNWNHIHP